MSEVADASLAVIGSNGIGKINAITTPLGASIRLHDEFFTGIVKMIPAELYTHSNNEDDIDAAEMETKYAHNRKLPLSKDERKAISKAKKLEKYAYAAPTENTGTGTGSFLAAATDKMEEAKVELHNEKKEKKKSKKDKKAGKEQMNDQDDAAPSSSSSHVVSLDAEESTGTSSKGNAAASDGLSSLRERLQARIISMQAQRTSNKRSAKQLQKQTSAANASTGSTEAGDISNNNHNNSSNKNKQKSAIELQRESKRARSSKSDSKKKQSAANDVPGSGSGTAMTNGKDGDHDGGGGADDDGLASVSSYGSYPTSASSRMPSKHILSSSSGSIGGDDLHFSLMAQPTASSTTSASSSSHSQQLSQSGTALASAAAAAAAAAVGATNTTATKPKGNKLQRLQRLLQEAEKKRKRMRQLSQSKDPAQQQQLQGEKWNDALKAAAGEKAVIVGSSSIEGTEGKLKKALKKREKRKQKSAAQWAERLGNVSEAETAKQARREGNLQARILKKKGVVVDPAAAATAANTNANTEGAAGSGRKRLWSHLKFAAGAGESKNNNSSGSSAGAGAGATVNNNKRKPGGSSGSGSGASGHRAGFEGKKKEYLNK